MWYVLPPNRQSMRKCDHAAGTRGAIENGGAPARQAENRLQTGPIEPTGRAGVPRPSAAAHVLGMRVDIARHDIRLGRVASGAGRVPRVVDRVDHVEELERLVAVAQSGERHDRPDRGVRVLPAILADARQIPLM